MSNGSSYGCEETIESMGARTSSEKHRAKPSRRIVSKKRRDGSIEIMHSSISSKPYLYAIAGAIDIRWMMPTVCPRASEYETRDDANETTKNTHARARARTANALALGLLSVAFTLRDDVPARVLRGGAVEGVRERRWQSIPTSFRARTGRIRGRPEANRRATPGGHRTGTRSASNRARFSRQSIPIGWWTRARAARGRSPARLSLARTASRSARGAFPLAFFAGAFFAGLFAAGFARDTVFFAGVAVFFTARSSWSSSSSSRVAEGDERGGGRSRGRDRSIGPSPSPRGRPTIAGIAVGRVVARGGVPVPARRPTTRGVEGARDVRGWWWWWVVTRRVCVRRSDVFGNAMEGVCGSVDVCDWFYRCKCVESICIRMCRRG